MTKHEVKKDIFDDMHVIIRCEYISDLRYKQFAVFYELKSMNLNVYSHDNIVNIIFTKNVNLKITRNVNLLLPVLLTYVYLFRPFLVFQHIHKILGSI